MNIPYPNEDRIKAVVGQLLPLKNHIPPATHLIQIAHRGSFLFLSLTTSES